MPSKITAQSKDSMAPSMAILKATGTRARKISKDHKASPVGVSHSQGSLKLGRKGGIPCPSVPSGKRKVKRLPMVSTSQPKEAKSSDTTTPTITAGKWPGMAVRKRGHKINTAKVAKPTTSVGQCSCGK